MQSGALYCVALEFLFCCNAPQNQACCFLALQLLVLIYSYVDKFGSLPGELQVGRCSGRVGRNLLEGRGCMLRAALDPRHM